MKKSILLALVLTIALIAAPAFADVHNTAGVKLDAPNLVKLTQNLTVGMEGGKEIATDLFYDELAYTEDDQGYFGFVKITYAGCLLNCN